MPYPTLTPPRPMEPTRASVASRLLRRARFAVLLAPAFLAGCYVVPVVPVGRPIYRTYPGPYYGPYRGYYRSGQAEQPVTTAQAAGGPAPDVHIEVASNAR